MKKSVILFLCVMFAVSLSAQTIRGDTTIAKKGLCHTLKRKGIEIYILTEPVNEYEIAGEVDDADFNDVLNALSGSQSTRTLTQSIDNLIDNANTKSKKKKKPFSFDAIITEDGSTGTCIKFK